MTARVDDMIPVAPGLADLPPGLSALLLARAAVPAGATRAEIVRDLMPLVAHRLSPAEWRATASDEASRLVGLGFVAETRGRLSLTGQGAVAMQRAFGGKGSWPATWPEMRDGRIVARALDIEHESSAKLKALSSPEGLRALILQKAFGLPLKGNQTANRLRVELAVVALERAFGNKIKGGLGASGGFTAKAGRLLAGQLSSRPRDFGADGRLIAELAAERVGSPQADVDALRLALLKRFVSTLLAASHSSGPPAEQAPRPLRVPAVRPPQSDAAGARPAANDTGPTAIEAVPSDRPGIADFAREVKSTAAAVAEGWPGNRKAFISRVWHAIRSSWPEWRLSEIEFKCMLVEAHRSGHVVLANADLKDRKSVTEIDASAIAYKNTVWHYVRVED